MKARSLVVGLGNPGKQYDLTRHNVGFMVVDALAEKHRSVFRSGKGEYLLSDVLRLEPAGEEIVLLKPLTYMNNSGLAVRHALDYYKFEVAQLLVISDDFQLPLGKLRFRTKGSEGGHNGLRSIISHLGMQDFVRLRLGIADAGNANAAHYVLAPFAKAEQEELHLMLQKACDAVCDVARYDVEYVMNRYN
ncbi:MAG: aminoacyl-tRNA hydrolase [candidate division KSB1 bacterium]